jgi:hypothetical protein
MDLIRTGAILTLVDHNLLSIAEFPRNINTSVDLRSKVKEVYRQHFNDCGSHGFCAAYSIVCEPNFKPSRHFLYYVSRTFGDDLSPNARIDTGIAGHTAIDGYLRNGICSEHTWPYIDGNVFLKPSQQAYDEAESQKNKIKAPLA